MLRNTNGGYVWLIMLFFGVVLIIVIAIQGGYLPGSQTDGNFLDKTRGVIDQTKETKQKLEDGYRFDPEAQERSIEELN